MLMAILHLESEFKPDADNGRGYVGLIQFSAGSAQSVGTTQEALKKMSFITQMDYVEAYLKKNKDKMKTLVDFYLQVLKPNAVGQGNNPDYVVFDESISVPDGDGSNTSSAQRLKNITQEPWVTKYGYSSNPSFMKESEEYSKRRKWVYTRQRYEDRWGLLNGKTYIWEIEKEIKSRHYDTGIPEKYTKECKNEKKEEKKPKEKGEYPKWVEIAIAEEKKGISEANNCQYIIDTYHNSTGNAKMKKCSGSVAGTHEWCAAFVNYCLKTAGYESQDDPGARWYKDVNKIERKDGAPAHTTDIWAKKYTTMYMGGVIVWKSNTHTAFLVGIDKNNINNYIILGGNQDNNVRFWTAPKTKVHASCLFPISYDGDLLPLEEIEPSDLREGAKKYSEGSRS